MVCCRHRTLAETHDELLSVFGVKKTGLKLERITAQEDMRNRMKYLVRFETKQSRTAFEYGKIPLLAKERFEDQGNTTWVDMMTAFARA